MDVAAGISNVEAAQIAFQIIAALNLTRFKWPEQYNAENGSKYDYIIVGGGTAGSVVANRLSEGEGCSVLLIEAGDDPTIETQFASLFPILPRSSMDWNYTTENEGNTAHSHQYSSLLLASGKVLGGSSTFHHLFYNRGVPNDYNSWVDATKDKSWSWDSLLPYFKKSQRLEDPLINSTKYGQYHGAEGPTRITREINNQTLRYLDAFKESGNNVVEDFNAGISYGFTQPMYYISKSTRQSSAESFLSPIKTRPNLHVMKNTEVIKILIDSKKTAVGVEAITSSGTNVKIYANNEVIVSAGVFNTPKLLMLSGIGPKERLEKLNIDVVSDLPVGKNFQDHMGIVLAHQMEKTNDLQSARDPGLFPLPSIVGYSALNKTQKYPDYYTTHLICRNSPQVLFQLCTTVMSLNKVVCEELIKAGTGTEILFTLLSKTRPWSVGNVFINSTSYKDPPVIETGYLTDKRDLEENAAYIEDFLKVTNSSIFESVGAKTVDFTLPECSNLTVGSTDYWKCYLKSMMGTSFHYCCTSPMGTVLDSKLMVNGVKNLRVVDASAMTQITSGNTNAPIVALAEKAADLIKKESKCSSAT